jgi:hypothetical protein
MFWYFCFGVCCHFTISEPPCSRLVRNMIKEGMLLLLGIIEASFEIEVD